MDNKLLGGSRQEKYNGVGPHIAPEGFAFYGIKIRTAATEIVSLDEYRSLAISDKVENVINKSWENVNDLLDGEFINFEYLVASITLKNVGDSIWAYCVPFESN
jgi:hypothetical protein